MTDLNSRLRAAQAAKNTGDVAGLVGIVLVLLVIAFVLTPFAWLLGAWIFLGAWNLGVVGLAGAIGLQVATIGYWTAFGGVLFVRVLRRILTSFRDINIKGGGN